MRYSGVLIAVGICGLVQAQEVVRPDPVRRAKVPERAGRADKWQKGQKKGDFNSAARGEPAKKPATDRTRDERTAGAARVDKADKWARGQRVDTFKKAANAKAPDKTTRTSTTTEKKSGGTGAAAPPAGPKR